MIFESDPDHEPSQLEGIFRIAPAMISATTIPMIYCWLG